MLKRKKIDYKIKKRDSSYFVVLGNAFPTYQEQTNFYQYFTDKTKTLLDNLLNTNLLPTQENIMKRNMFCLDYFNKSKSKTLSIIYTELIDYYGIDFKNNEYYVPKAIVLTNISSYIDSRFLDKWTRLINVYKSEYDAIKPYIMTVNEEMEHQEKGITTETKGGDITDIGSNSKSGNDIILEQNTHSHTGSDTSQETHTGNNTKIIDYSGSDRKSSSENETGSETNKKINDTTTNQIMGFNSSSFVDSDKSSNNAEDTSSRNSNSTKNDTMTYNSKDSHTDSINESKGHTINYDTNNNEHNEKTFTYDTTDTVSNKKTLNTTDTVNHGKGFDNTREITRLGNIGNTSQQELIMKEFELRKIQIIDIIYKDIDSVLTRSKYI